jgi:hypothetical protein
MKSSFNRSQLAKARSPTVSEKAVAIYHFAPPIFNAGKQYANLLDFAGNYLCRTEHNDDG